MTCSVPICLLLHRLMPDGTEALLMAPDLTTALSDAAQAEAAGEWTAQRITAGRDTLLEGEALREAIAAKASP
jgi:hypothetical protein